jgi:hypothetical protein
MTREIVGILLIIFGVLCTFAGKVGVRNSDGGIVFWFGPALIAFGWILNYTSATKRCPWCSKQIRYDARKCKHCGGRLSNE